MSYTYDLDTEIGKVRLVIPDNSGEANAIFSDEELNTFISIETSWRSAAALAIETMASNDLLVMKLVRVKDVEVSNNDKVVSLLLQRAKSLRTQAASDDSFEIASIVYNEFSLRDQLAATILREG